MRDIDGAEFLYTGNGDLTANVDDVYWHCDGTPGLQAMTVKTVFYLSEANDGDGALNIIPGSCHPDFSAALFRSYAPLGEEYRRRSHDEAIEEIMDLAYTHPRQMALHELMGTQFKTNPRPGSLGHWRHAHLHRQINGLYSLRRT